MTTNPECIREVSNFGRLEKSHLLDHDVFSPEMMEAHLHKSPKLAALLENIQQLDNQDMKNHNKLFKHMIFTDVSSPGFGSKLIATGLIVKGWNPCFNFLSGSGFTMKRDDVLLETKGESFGMLLSKPFNKIPMGTNMIKSSIAKFNKRPENINGNLVRIMIVDQGFKEGIDMFDVKYVHLFDPMLLTDQKQAIGRSTRFCGQMGLKFHPILGWPLHVYKYDLMLGSSLSMGTLWQQKLNLDDRLATFSAQLEDAMLETAVDHDLTREIHTFNINFGVLGTAMSGGDGALVPIANSPSPKKMDFQGYKRYISQNFKQYAYDRVEMKNLCVKMDRAERLISFTPTQEFVSNYMTPKLPLKGMLLWHSVGSGKTCTAIATATNTFDREGYTILWVTRHTLKQDIWKNMVGQVCNMIIREKVKKGEMKLPKDIKSPMQYVSKNWIQPLSYKQFSNMLQKENHFYEDLTARNGEADPLRKTLVIIDEAHKLYSPNVAANERPDMQVLEDWINNSYAHSGKDSVRLLLMTATPFLNDGMELISLLNLLREDKITTDFTEFGKQYLDGSGQFSERGMTMFQNKYAGYVSYLNRSRDGRMFAHPVFHSIRLPIYDLPPEPPGPSANEKMRKIKNILKVIETTVKVQLARIKDCERNKKGKIKEWKQHITSMGKDARARKTDGLADCKNRETKVQKADCKETVTNAYQQAMTEIETMKAKLGDMDKECLVIEQKINEEIQAYKAAKNYEGLRKEYSDLASKVSGTKENIFQYKEEMMEVKEKLAATKSDLNQLMAEYKAKAEGVTDKGELKTIKDQFLPKIKAIRSKVRQLGDSLKKLRSKMKFAKESIGKEETKNYSQFDALKNRCKVTIHHPVSSASSKQTSHKSKTKELVISVINNFYVKKIAELNKNGGLNKRMLLLTFHPDKVPQELQQGKPARLFALAFNAINDQIKKNQIDPENLTKALLKIKL